MKLFTKTQLNQLIRNGTGEESGKDHKPVVKLFLPGSGCTWLLTEIDPEEHSLAFGLGDLGMGHPELGYFCLDEIASVKSKMGLFAERDLYFEGKYPISVYANAARSCRQITENDQTLARFVPLKNRHKYDV